MLNFLCCRRPLSPKEQFKKSLELISSSEYSSKNVLKAMKDIQKLLETNEITLSQTQKKAVTKLQKVFTEKQNEARNSIKRNLALECIAEDGCLFRTFPPDKCAFVVIALNMAGAVAGYLYSKENPDLIGGRYPSDFRNMLGAVLGLSVSAFGTCILPLCISNSGLFNCDDVADSFWHQISAQEAIVRSGNLALKSFDIDSQV